MRKLLTVIILLPIITFLWLIGWSLYYTGSYHISMRKYANNQQNSNYQVTVIIETVFQENFQ